MAKKNTKESQVAVDDYPMGEYKRTNLPTGEWTGLAPNELPGVGESVRHVSMPLWAKDKENLTDEERALETKFREQYIWRGKHKNDLDTLEVDAPVIYQQELIQPRILIEDMKRRTAERAETKQGAQITFDSMLTTDDSKHATGFYSHEEGWKNRLILGDSLQVMASLAENENLRGKVQMIYMDPPYGIKFNSNWQQNTKSTNVADGKDRTLEPEMIKAFRDTWHDGIHSYLGYLRDRLVIARDLLSESGSVFVQIGDENVHKVRALLDEVFGEENFQSQISYASTSGLGSSGLNTATNYVLWYCKNAAVKKFRRLFKEKEFGGEGSSAYKRIETENGERMSISEFENRFSVKFDYNRRCDVTEHCRVLALADVTSLSASGQTPPPFTFRNKVYQMSKGAWKTSIVGMGRLAKANRIDCTVNKIGYIRYFGDFPAYPINNIWTDTVGQNQFGGDKVYVCQTGLNIVKRCMLMTTDPGDLVLDPTCGSGTTAAVAEQWGRRWITIDTSRVAVAIARRRLMTTKFPYYVLRDSDEGVRKEQELTGRQINESTHGYISKGFVYRRIPHIKLGTISTNAEIDVIWERYENNSLAIRTELGRARGSGVSEEWELPLDAPKDWSEEAKELLGEFHKMRLARQKEIDSSIARNAETEYLYDQPFETKEKRVRVAGPFTVESVAPVRTLVAHDDGTVTDPQSAPTTESVGRDNFVKRILETLRKNGVKQSRKADKIEFASLTPWAGGGTLVAEALSDGAKPIRYAIAVGPEFGSVSRNNINVAARLAKESGFDALLYCAFNFEAWAEEPGEKVMNMTVLRARMNTDLYMSTELKDTKSGNPFVIFGEPDIEIRTREDGKLEVEIKGVDVYDPKTGKVREWTGEKQSATDEIDAWMLDTDYNDEAFFVRQMFFPGKHVYKAFEKFMGSSIDAEEWEAASSVVSRAFERPKNGKIAVKVINYFGDEVVKVFTV